MDLALVQTALELGLICSLTVLALFLSYSMLNVCDLSTDGCFTMGAAVGAVVAIAGHPLLSLPAAMLAGVCSGFVTAVLQTKMGVDSLLAGIIVNTGLYSINIAIMGGSSLLNMNKTDTVFTMVKDLLENTPLAGQDKLLVAAAALSVWFYWRSMTPTILDIALVQVQSQTETHIIMELMRRDLARLENKQAHNAAAFAEPESFAPLRAAR